MAGALTGSEWTLVVAHAGDLERLISHHELTTLLIPSVGLEFHSERTAGLEMPLHMLLTLVEQDIRDNAAQVHSEAGEETHANLAAFFGSLQALRTAFPWTLTLRCPMDRASVEEGAADTGGQLTRVRFDVPDEERDRVMAAYADIAFDLADEQDEAEEAALRKQEQAK